MYKYFLIFGLLLALTSFGQWSEPVRLGGPINDDPSSKTWPSINEMGDTIYYAKEGLNLQENLCYSYRFQDSLWSAPIFMPSNVNSSDQRDLSPSIGPGDSILYFVTYERSGGYGSYDIWFTRRGPDGQWMDPENAGPNVNTASMEWGVFLSRNGRTLYFSSTRHGGVAFLDIWKSEWQDSGWGPAIHLEGNLNWITDEDNVTLPLDESYLILSAEIYAPTSQDLSISYPTDSGWSEPERITDLNSRYDEDGASLTPDGNTIYFASERNDTLTFRSELFISHRMSQIDLQLPQSPRFKKSSVYPNPYHGGSLRLIPGEKLGSGTLTFSLYNILGQRIAPISWASESGSLSAALHLRELPAGTYFLSIDHPRKTEFIPLVVVK